MATTIRFKKVDNVYKINCMFNSQCDEIAEQDGLCTQHYLQVVDLLAARNAPVQDAPVPPPVLYGKLKRRAPGAEKYVKGTIHIDGDVKKKWNGIDKFITCCSEAGCEKYAKANNKCVNHNNGVFKLDRQGAKDGEIFTTPEGLKYKVRGDRNDLVCKQEGCKIEASKEGLCKSHSPHHKCKHEGCTNIKVGGDFCKRHTP